MCCDPHSLAPSEVSEQRAPSTWSKSACSGSAVLGPLGRRSMLRRPAEVGVRDVDDARARDGRGRRVAQVLDLEHAASRWRVIGMRSPLASVRILLSSSTVFRFSIQMASTGPSSTSHVKFFLSLVELGATAARRCPSVHSLATTSMQPNICGARDRLGVHARLAVVDLVRRWSSAARSAWSSRMRVLPPPDGPTSMMPCRTRSLS